MPRKDGTGPKGNGPMTGNGLGHCATRQSGRGLGLRSGRCERRNRLNQFGRGLCRVLPNQNLTEEETKLTLENEAKFLEEELEAVKKELEKTQNQK